MLLRFKEVCGVALLSSSLMLMLASCIINEFDKQESDDDDALVTALLQGCSVMVNASSCFVIPFSAVKTTAPRRTAADFALACNLTTTKSEVSSVNKCVVFIRNLCLPKLDDSM